jgi:hypothetical protein
MDPASATLAGVTFVRLPSGWSEVAASALVLGDYRDVRWPQIETTSSVWLTRLEVRAVDALGRRSTAIRRSTTGVTAWPPELVTLDAPASLVAPPDGSAQVDRPVRLSWSAAQAKPLRHIVLTRSDAPGRWDVWAGGAGAELDLPRRDDLMPASSTWRWTVEELGAPSLSDASYDRAQLDATLSLRTLSAPSTFTTR